MKKIINLSSIIIEHLVWPNNRILSFIGKVKVYDYEFLQYGDGFVQYELTANQSWFAGIWNQKGLNVFV